MTPGRSLTFRRLAGVPLTFLGLAAVPLTALILGGCGGAREATHLAGPPERVADRERAHRSLAALASLKPAETRALVLQAAGRSYRDIEAETGWTSTKVNRALTEGRATLRQQLAAIDEGTDCPRHAHHIPALARGIAPADEPIALRALLRACGPCRARLGDLR
jgi:hypothetical protein